MLMSNYSSSSSSSSFLEVGVMIFFEKCIIII